MRYFDYNATTPLNPKAKDAWVAAYEKQWQNPSSTYSAAIQVKAHLKRERARLASILSIDPDSIVFCSGATEACNMWVRSFFETIPDQTLLVSKQEHSCIRKSVEAYANENVIWFSPLSENLETHLSDLLHRNKKIGGIIMMAANNETGVINPWGMVQELCKRNNIPFFCDTCQWIGKQPTKDLHILDFFCASAHKFGGPKGIGFLKKSDRYPFYKGFKGGDQEGGYRSGTEDFPSISAMTQALKETSNQTSAPDEITKRISWKNHFQNELAKKIPPLIIHNNNRNIIWNTLSIALPQMPATYWLEELDKQGFMVSTGSACASNKTLTSPVLSDTNVEKSVANRTLRISAGWTTNAEDWNALLNAIQNIWESLNKPEGLTEVISIDDL